MAYICVCHFFVVLLQPKCARMRTLVLRTQVIYNVAHAQE